MQFKTEHGLEETICMVATVHPEGYDFANKGLAGVVKNLAEQIILGSGFAYPGQTYEALEYHREQMRNFENQSEVIISQAFKNITFAEMQEWTQDEFLEHVARAEWALKYVWGIDQSFNRVEENETPTEEEPSFRELGNQFRDMGLDPMMELRHLTKPKPPYVDLPLIGGTSLFKNEEVLDRVRKQIQGLPE